MGKKRAKVWEGYEFSEDGRIAICKECRSQLVAYGDAGTSHVRRHKKICIGRQDRAAPPPDASNWDEATAIQARQEGSPPIASPPTVPAALPLGALPESSSSIMGANWEEATADLARTIALHGFGPSFAEDRAPPPIPSPPTIPAAPPPGAPPESSNCSKAANWEEEATTDLARMIALHGYDPSFVEDSYFRSFVRRLNPDFQVPSRAAIEDICDGVFVEARGVLRSELEHTSGKVNLAIDTAETALGEVVYAACHFIDEDWNRRMMILEVRTVVPEDMDPLPLSVKGYDLTDYELKMFGMGTSDLPTSDWVFSKAIGTNGDLEDWLEVVAQYETTCNHNDALQMVASSFVDIFFSFPIYEPYFETKYLNNETRQERGQIYSQLGLDHLPTYDKEWISFYFSLQLVHKRRKEDDISSPVCKSDELTCSIFREIYHASKTISDPNRPTSNIVLRELFKVRETLQSSLAHATGDELDFFSVIYIWDDIVDVLKKAVEILDRSIKKEYRQWSIPLVLDPRYKLKYIEFLFSRAFSSEAEQYIAKITHEIEELFTSFSIDGAETPDADPVHETEITSAHQLQQAWSEHRQRLEVTKTELDRYLEGPLMKDTDDFDILNWWKLNSSKHPTLARMARAALAMPTCSKLSSEQMSQITSIIRGYSNGKLDY